MVSYNEQQEAPDAKRNTPSFYCRHYIATALSQIFSFSSLHLATEIK